MHSVQSPSSTTISLEYALSDSTKPSTALVKLFLLEGGLKMSLIFFEGCCWGVLRSFCYLEWFFRL
jgi:hypothetical protein